MKKYILSLDQGTSSCRALLFDKEFNLIGIEQKEFSQKYPKPGWVEQDPKEILEVQIKVAQDLLKSNNISADEIISIGITNQRETTVLWNKNTGEPVYNAIVWQDKRTSGVCNELKDTYWNDYISQNTGLWIDSYFSATKIQWILENIEEVYQNAKYGDILFGTIDTWLIWNLTGKKAFVTDYTNASRTMLYNIRTLDWDKKLLSLFNIPPMMLPRVVDSAGFIANTEADIFGVEIPISGVAGDQQAALFGQLCFEPGTAKNTYGTGCFILMNTGKHVFHSLNGMISTIAWGIDGNITYALEGSVFIAGAAIKWLRDSLGLIKSAAETEEIAKSIASSEGVYVVPAFSGLGAPYWDMQARAAIVGLTQGSSKNNIIRATLESIAYQTKDVFDAMYEDSKLELEELYVDGGASANDFLMQFQADILNTKVVRPKNIETTALGAAYLAALGSYVVNFNDLKKMLNSGKEFKPQMEAEKIAELYEGWKNAIKKIRA